MLVLKVLVPVGDDLVSPSARGHWRLRYKSGKWTEPKRGKIMVWENSSRGMDLAKKYLAHSVLGKGQIWICEAEGVCPRAKLASHIIRVNGVARVSTPNDWDASWNGTIETEALPVDGELMADRIKPLMTTAGSNELTNELLAFLTNSKKAE